eukprot:CAMPEP_0183729898 /NCGR_PEP_ID=MMETSP0737-20130205/31446_1 /TAXON_ID=385413 /ORGANISM="Thalassiosira miniscula, Strain CCMP1093" /LENGTH=427 /DNA_ID=CAMNT_0025962213 /DNA_START=186 /DNA_END=1469 /DNA_ORIENTATION=-
MALAGVDSIRMGSNEGGEGERVVRWAIIGLGDVCAVKSGPAFYKCHGSTLSAVMRRTPGAAQEWIKNNASNLPGDVARSIRAFDTVEQMMEEMGSSLDAIYVASPPGAHLENVRQIVTCLSTSSSSSLKAVYVEKPCGRCAWETRAMADELRARNIEFYPAYVSRAHERTQILRKLLSDDKVCGEKVTHIKYTQRGSSFARGLDGTDGKIPWRLVASQSGGGLIMDMGCHVLDRLDYLFGPLGNIDSNVLCKGAQSSSSSQSYPLVEDYVAMSATIGDCDWSAIPSTGASVECIWDFSPKDHSTSTQKDEVDELEISGPEGSVRMAAMGPGLPIRISDADGKLVRTLEFDPPAHSAQPLIQSVVNELLNLEKDGENSSNLVRSPARADNAVRTSEVLDAILGSYYGGRHDEFWIRSGTWRGLQTTKT